MPKTYFRADFPSGPEYRSSESRDYVCASKPTNGDNVQWHSRLDLAKAGSIVAMTVKIDEKLGKATIEQETLKNICSELLVQSDENQLAIQKSKLQIEPENRYALLNVRIYSDNLAKREAARIKLAAHIAKHGTLV